MFLLTYLFCVAVVECPDPNVLTSGNVSPPQERYFLDNETTYECDSGDTLRGSSRRVCLPNGKWSGSTPICSRDSKAHTLSSLPALYCLLIAHGFGLLLVDAAGDHCSDPGIPAGGMRSGNIFGIEDKVKYSCTNKLFLMGSSERTCQENGQWTGNEPACYCKTQYLLWCTIYLFDHDLNIKLFNPSSQTHIWHSSGGLPVFRQRH